MPNERPYSCPNFPEWKFMTSGNAGAGFCIFHDATKEQRKAAGVPDHIECDASVLGLDESSRPVVFKEDDAKLIVAAPRMLRYIMAHAELGRQSAINLINEIFGAQPLKEPARTKDVHWS